MTEPNEHLIRDAAQLASLYGQAGDGARLKELPALSTEYRALIEASPFVVLATVGPQGLDASPRGDPPGFVVVQDERTLLLPDRRGNNRIDSLANILADPRVALLFMVPGTDETLRVNGQAVISIDPDLCERLGQQGKAARSVLVIAIETVYFQCARALLRAKLWQPGQWPDRASLPSPGRLLAGAAGGRFDAEAIDRDAMPQLKQNLY